MTDPVVAAVDLGASAGRVIAGRVSASGIDLHEISRFPNEPVSAGGTLYWDILRLYGSVGSGLRSAASSFRLASIGIDSWGVDYGLIDATGALLGNPVHYRDSRTEHVATPVPHADLYAVTGIQHLPFNTIYQLSAAAGTPALSAAKTLLLIPDLLAYWLTGSVGAEVTNASTTSLLDISIRQWSAAIMRQAGIPPALFPPLRQPGEVIGPVTDDVGAMVPLVAVGSHDTASAVAAVPAAGPDFAYISSGTWSLVGMELSAPVLTEDSRLANFTNEAGLDGTIRYLRNVAGLWLLQECIRHWGPAGPGLDALLAAAAAAEPLRFIIDVDDPVFLPPGDMPARICSWLTARGLPAPSGPENVVRCILDSLAIAYRRALLAAQSLSGRHAGVVHIVGGGSRNHLLCQLTADATGLPVVAGPAEATALGNVLVQARALGAAPGSLDGMRQLLRSSMGAGLRRFAPAGDGRAWSAAARRAGLDLCAAEARRGVSRRRASALVRFVIPVRGGCEAYASRMLGGQQAIWQAGASFDTFQSSPETGTQCTKKRVKVAVSIREVAAEAGVSMATVSNVLNRPEIVAQRTRDRVNAVIRDLGFVRNESARQLRAGRSRTIGLVVLDVANPFFTDLARGVEDEVSEAGLAVILCNSDDRESKERRYLELLEEHRVQGVLITPVAGAATTLAGLQRRGTPVVLVDSRAPSRGQCSVAVDDVLGGELAVTHLLDIGHEKIAYISGPPAVRQVADRRDGALRALRRAGRPAESLQVIETSALNVAAGKWAGAEIVSIPAASRPTAVFCANDLMALGVLQEMTRNHIRVPDDMSIVGYDDIDFAAAAAVPLTSVRQPRQQLGRTAARLLLEEAADDDVTHQHRQVIFEPELVVRQSTQASRPGDVAVLSSALLGATQVAVSET